MAFFLHLAKPNEIGDERLGYLHYNCRESECRPTMGDGAVRTGRPSRRTC